MQAKAPYHHESPCSCMVQKPEKTFVGLSLCPYRNTEQCPSNAVTYDTYSDLEYTQSFIHTKAVQKD